MSLRVVLLVCAAMTVAGLTFAAQGGGGGAVTLCAEKHGGELTLGKKGRCPKGEKKVTIAKQGPPGAPGAAGADGTSANLESEDWHAVGPAVSFAACPSQPGNFCNTGVGPDWTSEDGSGVSYPPVAYRKDALGDVHLRGLLTQEGQGVFQGGIAFYLPAGYRPTDGAHEFPARSSGTLGDATYVRVGTDGSVRTDDFCCATLDGVEFRP